MSGFRVALNSIFNFGGVAAGIIITFFLTPFVVAKLGKEAYGVWVTVGSVAAYSYLLNVGFSNAVTRYVPIARTQKNITYLNEIISTSSAFYALGGLVMAILTLTFAPFVPDVFNVPENLAKASIITFLCAGLSIAISMPLGISLGFITGLQRYDISNGVRLSMTLLRTVAVVVFLSIGYGLVSMAVIDGCMRLSILGLYWLFIRRLVPDFTVSKTHAKWSLFKELIGFGFNTFIYVIGSLLIYKSDIIIIGILLGPEKVAIYAIPVILMGLISTLVTAATNVLQPAAAAEYAKGNIKLLGDYYVYGLRYTVLFLAPVVSLLLIRGADFITLWMGHDFELSGRLLPVLSIAQFIYISQRSSFQVLSAAGKHKFFGGITIATGVTNITISVILVTQFNLGLWGVAFGTFFPMLLLGGVVIFAYSSQKLGVSMWHAAQKSYLVGFISVVPSVLVLLVCNAYWKVDNWFMLVTQCSLAMLLWMVCTWFAVFSRVEKKKVINGLAHIKMRILP